MFELKSSYEFISSDQTKALLIPTLMSPHIRQPFSSSISPRLPLLSPPFQKVLETVCINCKLGETPLTKNDYIKLFIKLSKENNEMS